jgi:hypothetical protein
MNLGSGAYYDIPNNIVKAKKTVEENSSDPIEKYFKCKFLIKLSINMTK